MRCSYERRNAGRVDGGEVTQMPTKKVTPRKPAAKAAKAGGKTAATRVSKSGGRKLSGGRKA